MSGFLSLTLEEGGFLLTEEGGHVLLDGGAPTGGPPGLLCEDGAWFLCENGERLLLDQVEVVTTSDGRPSRHQRQDTLAFGHPEDRGIIARSTVGRVTVVGSTPVRCVPKMIASAVAGLGKPGVRAVQNPTAVELEEIARMLLAAE